MPSSAELTGARIFICGMLSHLKGEMAFLREAVRIDRVSLFFPGMLMGTCAVLLIAAVLGAGTVKADIFTFGILTVTH